MADQEFLRRLVFDTIDEINRSLPVDGHVQKDLETPLYADEGKLDSLGLLDLIVFLERKLAGELGVTVSLAAYAAAPGHGTPFQTVGTLVGHLARLLDEKEKAA
jgi:D-alanine--poly(phosphoribitol) ligase subunit 2